MSNKITKETKLFKMINHKPLENNDLDDIYPNTYDENGIWTSKIVKYDDFLHDPATIKIRDVFDENKSINQERLVEALTEFSKKYPGFKPDRIRFTRAKPKPNSPFDPLYNIYLMITFYADYKYVKSDYLLERLNGMTVNDLQKDFNITLYNGKYDDTMSYQKSIKALAHGVLKFFNADEFSFVEVCHSAIQQGAVEMCLKYHGLYVLINAYKNNRFDLFISTEKLATYNNGLPKPSLVVDELSRSRKDVFEILHRELKS